MKNNLSKVKSLSCINQNVISLLHKSPINKNIEPSPHLHPVMMKHISRKEKVKEIRKKRITKLTNIIKNEEKPVSLNVSISPIVTHTDKKVE
jgi:hypothetical protein